MFDRQVTLPEGYFSQSKNEYANWRQSWWREAVQNAADAKAKHIQLFAQKNEQGKLVLTCKDDGCGMSKEVLLDVFLAMGGSNKGEGDCGGFGYAKVILLFAQESYSIRTGKHKIEGRSGNYRYEECDEEIVGTTIQAVLEDDTSDHVMIRYLSEWLQYAKLPSGMVITINGDVIAPEVEKMDYHLNSSLGPISFRDDTDNTNSSLLWVRMKGLCMFSHHMYHEDNQLGFVGVLDLDLSSKEVLTSNRDGLKREYSRQLTQLFNSLSNERTKLKCQDLIDITFNTKDVSYEEEYGNQSEYRAGVRIERDRSGQDLISALMGEHTNDHPFEKLKSKVVTMEEKVRDRFFQINGKSYPVNFKIKTHQLKHGDPRKRYFDIARRLELKKSQRMAWSWDTIVSQLLRTEWALRELRVNWRGEQPFIDGTPVHTGFVFSDEAAGLEVKGKEQYQILLNPDALPDDMMFEDMLDIAIHEVCHLAVSGHGEWFCAEEIKIKRSMRRHMKVRELEILCKSIIKDNLP